MMNDAERLNAPLFGLDKLPPAFFLTVILTALVETIATAAAQNAPSAVKNKPGDLGFDVLSG